MEKSKVNQYKSFLVAMLIANSYKIVSLFFIYVTFFTVGLSFGLYLTMAFLLKLKDMVYTKRNSVFDL